jgi:hypothetical protein
MLISRRSLLTSIAAGVGFAGTAHARSREATGSRVAAEASGNEIIVGPGGDYPDIPEAIASITDNSALNPYRIILRPGSYSAFETKEFVDIVGAGLKSSIVETAGDSRSYITIGSNTCLADFGIRYSGTAASDVVRGAIQKQPGTVTEVVLRNLEIRVEGIAGVIAPKYAINFGGKVDITAWNVRIATESGGLRLSDGQSRWHGCDIYLRGHGVGLPHSGVVLESGNRFDFYGGRIGTGYYYDADLGDPDQDVIGLYIPASNTGGNNRAEIHDAEMFARNVSPAPGVRVNAVRAENGWVRMYGCFCQTEIDPDVNGNGSASLYAAFRTPNEPSEGEGGKIEAYGCRVRSVEGYVIGGSGIQGAVRYDATSHGVQIQRYENLCLCDASAGPFTLKLANDDPPTTGDDHVFKKIDSTSNPITIDGNGSLIDGLEQIVLRNPRGKVRVRRVGSSWYLI